MNLIDNVKKSIEESLLKEAKKQFEKTVENSTISNVKISVEAKTNI